MNPSISKKMDMVKNVFLKQKKLEEDLLSVEDWMMDNHTHVFIDEYFPERQLLTEGKSKKKISNSRKCRIKNSKGDYVDIKKIKNDKKDDTNLLELPPPEGDENLISIGNQMTIPESLRLLERIKRGKKKFRDFMNQKPTFIGKKTEEILF